MSATFWKHVLTTCQQMLAKCVGNMSLKCVRNMSTTFWQHVLTCRMSATCCQHVTCRQHVVTCCEKKMLTIISGYFFLTAGHNYAFVHPTLDRSPRNNVPG